ncbi:MAG: nucleotide sugar dehydrogenase, partial [Phycisphaerales bacterium]|nr:nucleotide sugar dehydrogenase [Phycisphaerales bacterium]
GQLVVLESTTWPGTTRELMVPLLERSGLIFGEDFFVGYSPEREDPGRLVPSPTEVPKVVSGLDGQSLELTNTFYNMVFSETHKTSSVEVAESSKLLENIYRAVNIALVNEMKVVLDKLDIDVWEVVEAASTKPYGFTPFYPGPGLGGHCIPIDPFYMSWKARQVGTETRFIELAGDINRNMPHIVVEKVLGLLSKTSDPSVLVLGIAYKPNVDDIREAPSAEIISQLQQNSVSVSYHDPHCPIFPTMKRYDINLDSVPLTNENLSGADLVLIVTHHDNIDWGFVGEHAKLIVDTRNVMNQYPQYSSKVIKA